MESLADASTKVRCWASSRLVVPVSLLLVGWDEQEDMAVTVHLLVVADSEDEEAAAGLRRKAACL